MYLSFFFGMKGKTNKNVYFVYQKIYIFYATRLKLSHIASSKKDVHFEITYIEDRSKLMTSGRGHFELTNFTKMDFVFCNWAFLLCILAWVIYEQFHVEWNYEIIAG